MYKYRSFFKIACIGVCLCMIMMLNVSCSCNKEITKPVPTNMLKTDDLKPAYGDILIEGTIADAQTLNPLLSTDTASGDVIGLIFNGLIKYDENLDSVGDLAEKWEVTENGFKFYLRKNVKWHDGEKFDADDVVYTYKLMMNPLVKYQYRSYYKYVKSVKKLDEYLVEVEYTKKTANSLLIWGTEILPEHILKNEKDVNNCTFNKKPIGTGPFKLKSWLEGDRIELESNKDYFEGQPYLSRYMFRVIPNKSVMFLCLQKGEIDFMYLKPDQFRKQSQNEGFKSTFNLFSYADFNYSYMGFNLNNPIFKDKKIREAISMAINRKEIIEGVIFGLGKVCTGPFPPISWAYDQTYKPPEYNLENAKKLLLNDGWKDGDNDGILEKDLNNDGNDEILKFELLTNNGNRSRELTATIIQDQLRKIGIKVVTRFLEWNTLNRDFIDTGNFEAVILGWELSKDPAFINNIWESGSINEGNNFVSFNNSEVDKLLEEGTVTLDKEKRKIIYRKMHRLIAQEYPYVFLYSKNSLVAINKRFHGVKISAAGIKHNLIKWYVPKKLQKY